MSTLAFTETGLSSIVCSSENCLSWIIVLLNILTVFYLVFCAWFKVSKAVKVVGYVMASVLTVGTVIILAIHTCIFTILCAVFSALIVMAVLSVVFDKGILADVMQGDNKIRRSHGCYVIHKTDKDNYCFILYDDKKNAVAKSNVKYATIEQARKAVEACRQKGYNTAIEDRTQDWIAFVNYPKFQLVGELGKFHFVLLVDNDLKAIKSENFDDYEQAKKVMNSTRLIVLSRRVFFTEKEIVSDDQFEELAINNIK